MSPNNQDQIHNATGQNCDDIHLKPQYLIALARERGVLTCGIGDAGNEIGFGLIEEAVKEIMPAGRACRCSCGGGMAAAITTDALMVAAISDWGAYALVAVLAHQSGRTDLLVTADDVERLWCPA